MLLASQFKLLDEETLSFYKKKYLDQRKEYESKLKLFVEDNSNLRKKVTWPISNEPGPIKMSKMYLENLLAQYELFKDFTALMSFKTGRGINENNTQKSFRII